MSQAKYIADWLKSLEGGGTVQVRHHTEIIESLSFDSENAASIAEELIEIASNDARDLGRTRSYTFCQVNEQGERLDCPISYRHKVNRGDNTAVSAQAVVDMALKLAESAMKDRDRIAKRDEEREARYDEDRKLSEKLRTEAQERELAKEKHEKLMEVLQQAADAGIPLAVAMVNKFSGGKTVPMLGEPDMKVVALQTLIKSLSESQLKSLPDMVGPELWPQIEPIIEAGLYSQVTPQHVKAFQALANAMPQEQLMTIASILNPGQGASLGVFFNDDN